MYLLIEKGLKGGISYIAKVNNKYMKNYDPTKPSNYVSYLDMNNLYGWALSSYLPYGGFKWLKNADNFDVNSVSENSPIGYILKFDQKYPDELHVLHNDYQLAPEKFAVPYDMLSNYCKKIADDYGIIVGNVMKLIPNLGNKTNYVLHYRSLQLYLSLGMKLTKTDKVLKFKQSDWLKKYINFNTEKEQTLLTVLKKTFFKLMINSVYGKTMENLRTTTNVRLINNEKDFSKCTSRPTHITHKIFDKNYAAIHEIKPVLTLSKQIYVGLTVLELSKWLMYDFHYNFIEKHLNAELLFTDTDNLTYEIKSKRCL